MPETAQSDPMLRPSLSEEPPVGSIFAAFDGFSADEAESALDVIAARIGSARKPGAESDIPAGSTYFAQFVIHDLDFRGPDDRAGPIRLDLALIYGDGPGHDATCYQVPSRPGMPRHLLRIGRSRPTPTSPAWGAARDLPRIGCPHLDAHAAEAKTEVLVPNRFSDSNLLLGQVQTLWMLLHNAIAGQILPILSAREAYNGRPADAVRDAFRLAQRVCRNIYAQAIRADVLNVWLMPELRAVYGGGRARSPAGGRLPGTPPEFLKGVGRLGHGLVREIYALGPQMPVVGLRNLIRHTGTGRPHNMPLTEDWLVDFSRFVSVEGSKPQHARALGPHVARAFAHQEGMALAPLIRRDLEACTSGRLRSIAALVEWAGELLPEGSFAADPARWQAAVADWLNAEEGLSGPLSDRLAVDPPLVLFLMLEAEADTGGRTLGALGSILMGETLAAALPEAATGADIDMVDSEVFGGKTPVCLADIVTFLQSHYRFAEGARLHPVSAQPSSAPARSRKHSGDQKMLDTQNRDHSSPIPRIEVADYIEMGRLVHQWVRDPDSRPTDVAGLKRQLDGIAEVPDRIKEIEFCQGTLEKLVLRLPVPEMIEESYVNMTDPMAEASYPFPQFYADVYKPGFGPVMTPLETLLARVGDYTIAQCK
jgi:hypothetical protein